MKKKLQLTILLFTAILFKASAVVIPDSIGVKKMDGKSFVVHQVENSEGWFSIAHMYGISYADLRLANKDSSDKLVPGMTILVPLDKLKANDPHFQKNYTQGSDELFYTVKEGETLFGIARKFLTSVDSLKKWNHLVAENLRYGQKLKVGYKSKQVIPDPETAEIKNNKKSIDSTTETSDGPKKNTSAPDSKSAKSNVVARPDSTTAVKKTTASQVKTVKTTLPKDSTKIIKTASVLKTETPKSVAAATGKGRKEFNETGVASWIGDNDINPNKYYALHRTAPIGTIIKVTNKMNNKYVFVKVVGTLPDTGDNTDLVIKISKASAEKLGVRDSRFQSVLNYGVTQKP